jgi:hypothetical protein
MLLYLPVYSLSVAAWAAAALSSLERGWRGVLVALTQIPNMNYQALLSV